LFSLHSGDSLEKSRTIAFAALIFWNVGTILIHRDSKGRISVLFSLKNRILNRVVALTVICFVMIVTVAPASRLFHFTSLSLSEWLMSLGVGLFTLIVSAILSFSSQWKHQPGILASQPGS
jgi:magnesium-transporting ATPase (P-type)